MIEIVALFKKIQSKLLEWYIKIFICRIKSLKLNLIKKLMFYLVLCLQDKAKKQKITLNVITS